MAAAQRGRGIASSPTISTRCRWSRRASTPRPTALPSRSASDDWLAGPDGTPESDVVIAGDVCYEREMSVRALAWLRGHATARRLVLLGDPGRNYFSAQGLLERARYDIPTSLQLENRGMRETVVWQVLPHP